MTLTRCLSPTGNVDEQPRDVEGVHMEELDQRNALFCIADRIASEQLHVYRLVALGSQSFVGHKSALCDTYHKPVALH
jgi:hypothetical protein